MAYTEELKNDNDFNLYLQVRSVEYYLVYNSFMFQQVKQKQCFIITNKKVIYSDLNSLTIPIKKSLNFIFLKYTQQYYKIIK